MSQRSVPITATETLGTDGYWCPKHPHAWHVEKRVGGVRSFDLVYCDGAGVVDVIAEDLQPPLATGHLALSQGEG